MISRGQELAIQSITAMEVHIYNLLALFIFPANGQTFPL